MKIIYLSTLIGFVLFVFVPVVYSTCNQKSGQDIKTYVIDLDKHASERFTETAADFATEINALIEAQKKELNLTKELIAILELIVVQVDKIFPYPFNEELKGIAKASNSNLGDVIVANLIYDATAFCTSIVTTQADGKIIHGRNLDYNFPSFLTNLTYMAEFRRNGTVLFRSAQLAGMVGILTGHKYKSFTFSLNERDQGFWWVNLLFALLDHKATPLFFLTRQVMENATNFNDAVKKLSTTDLIAPVYFIIGGIKPNEGAVITRDQYEVVDTWRLDGVKHVWYLLETNYDHWVPPPSADDRRTPGMKAMNATTQANINRNTLMDVLTIQPVCNRMTVYSVTMSAADEAIQIIIRYI